MAGWPKGVTAALLAVAAASFLGGVETGDVDGDGRLTIKDVIQFREGLPPGEGSLKGFEQFPCYEDPASPGHWLKEYVPPSIYLESLRRSVPDALPTLG